jgi:hypothetical protein
MADSSDEAKARAEARFNQEKERSRRDDDVKAGIAAQARAVDKKTAHLKELRLAKEAGDNEARATGKPDGGHARKSKGKHVADPDEVKGGSATNQKRPAWISRLETAGAAAKHACDNRQRRSQRMETSAMEGAAGMSITPG